MTSTKTNARDVLNDLLEAYDCGNGIADVLAAISEQPKCYGDAELTIVLMAAAEALGYVR